MTRILDAAEALIRDNRGPGNPHPNILETGRMSLSMLAKNTAERCAELILADLPDEEEDAHWGRNGNALADMNLRPLRFHEGTLEVPLGLYDDIYIVGHFDGTEFFTKNGALLQSFGETSDGRAVIYENKAPRDDAAGNAEKLHEYYWQAAGYLAMLIEMHDQGVRNLYPAPWMPLDAPAIPLPEFLDPEGVVLTIQPYTAPEWEESFILDRAMLKEHMAEVRAKAQVVWKAVAENDPKVARDEWDLSPEALKWTRPELVSVTAKDAEEAARRLASAQARKKEAEDDAKKAKEVLEAYVIKEGGVDRAVKVLGQTVKLQEAKGGLRHFVARPTWSIRAYGPLVERDAEQKPEKTYCESGRCEECRVQGRHAEQEVPPDHAHVFDGLSHDDCAGCQWNMRRDAVETTPERA